MFSKIERLSVVTTLKQTLIKRSTVLQIEKISLSKFIKLAQALKIFL